MVYSAGEWSGLVLLSAACFAASIALLTRFLLRYYEPFSALIAATLGATLVLGQGVQVTGSISEAPSDRKAEFHPS